MVALVDMLAAAAPATASVHTTAPSPALYVTLVLYGLASMFYVSAFVDAPGWMRTAARVTLGLAFVAHGVEIGWRGVEGVHPGSSVREALGFTSWLVTGGYLVWVLRGRLALLGAFVAPAALVVLAAARLTPSGEAVPGLTLLGRVHISLAALGVAVFALATAVSVMYLLEERNLKRKRFDRALFKRGVALETLDLLAHRLVLVGFPIFTVSIMLGVVWLAQRATSPARIEYPLALIAWGTFGGLIIARTARGWRGRKAAMLTVVGFVAALVVFVIYLARRAIGG